MSAASGTLPEDVRTFYCCRCHNSVVVKDSLFLGSWQWCVPQTTHTHTHTECTLCFHCKNGHINGPQYFVVCTLPILS